MLSSLRMKLGMINVTVTPKNIVVEGIPTHAFFKDVYRYWGSSVFYKWMFTGIKSGELKLPHFFGLDFKYMCQELYSDKTSATPKRTLRKILDELNLKTWLGNVDRDIPSITDMSVIDHLAPFPLKPFQRDFVKLYGKAVPAYKLRGYMLDAGAGTGKTVTDIVLGEALHADHVIVLTPKNAMHRVWEDTIKDLILVKRSYWISDGVRSPSIDDHYYICHYEQLEQIVNFVRTNAKSLKNIFVVVDESHNFNRQASDRSQMLVELCQSPSVSNCLWASGTPIMAWGTECIPFLKCVDPMFTDDCEMRFRKIYGASAKRGLDILQHRIGHVKYHVPKQDVVDTVVNVHQIKVAIPNGDRFTLMAVREKMQKYADERMAYYEKNKALYHKQYQTGLYYFEDSLKTDVDRQAYATYKKYIALISAGFDPASMSLEAQYCNKYEQKTILPNIPPHLRAEFKSAKSVVKYVKLKVFGEVLGTILGRARTECHVEMSQYIDFPTLIDQATKKTLIFTSYVEVVNSIDARLKKEGFTTALVYGATNKDLSGIVKRFYNDPDLNPLAATFQSLSTAVPLTVANRIIMTNQPWRDGVRTQTIARAARLGQDSAVDVFDITLDTGSEPNISTRSNDILAWSAEMTSAILGVKNLDAETLSLESTTQEDGWLDEFLPPDLLAEPVISTESFESAGGVSAVVDDAVIALPTFLYHGSAFKQNELMPGFDRSGVLVEWDGCESNKWLYVSDNKQEAIMLGISSAIEKKWKLDRYHYDAKSQSILIEVSEPLARKDIENLDVFIYTLRSDADDGWMMNYNTQNGITGEYKTQRTVTSGIVKTERVNVAEVLRRMSVRITQH